MKIGTSRRSFLAITGAATLAAPLRAFAQQPPMKRVWYLTNAPPESGLPGVPFLRRGLAKQGWVEPRVSLEVRTSSNTAALAQQNAAELIKLQPDVFVALGNVNALALKAVTTSPIVLLHSADPLGNGLVNSLAHPGGNITGFGSYEASIGGKWLSVLKELSPRLETAAMLVSPGGNFRDYFWPSFASAAQAASVKPVRLEFRDVGDVPALLQSFAASPSPGLVAAQDAGGDLTVAQVAKLKLPTVWGLSGDGRVLAYGVTSAVTSELTEGAGEYAGLILNGTKPGDLPVQFPSKLGLIVNLKAAREQDIQLPEAMIVRAEEVIQ